MKNWKLLILALILLMYILSEIYARTHHEKNRVCQEWYKAYNNYSGIVCVQDLKPIKDFNYNPQPNEN